MSPRRPAANASHASHERWLVSYADFITLMFAFFVVLYATSRADLHKQQQVSQAIDSAFHALGLFPNAGRKPAEQTPMSALSKDDPIGPMQIVMGEEVMAPARVKDDLEQVQQHLQKLLADQIADHTVSVKMGKDGLVISLKEAGFFDSGSATPHPSTLPILHQVATLLGATPYQVHIEGHTDNLPIHNDEFGSNWELSTARATRIVRIFLATGSIKPERVSAAGFAEFHPVATNDTAAGRAENRRVDLVLRPQTTTDLTQPWADSTRGDWRKITDE